MILDQQWLRLLRTYFVETASSLMPCMLLGVLLAVPAPAQTEPSGVIRGRLTSVSGGALSGVTVSLAPVSRGAPAVFVTTDVAGQYRFPAVPYGRYVLHVALAGELDQAIQIAMSSVIKDLRTSGPAASFAQQPKTSTATPAAPSFKPSGVQGTIAPSGYSSGASDEENEQLRTHAVSLGLNLQLLAGQPPPACDQRQRLLHDAANDPKGFRTKEELGLLALAHGDDTEALGWLESAQRLQPGNVANERALATTYLQLGRYADARKLVDSLLADKPAPDSLLLLSAEVYAAQGSVSQARSEFLKAGSIGSSPDVGYAAGLGLLRLNLAADAQVLLRNAVGRSPSSVPLKIGLSMALASMGEKSEAASLLLKVVRDDPNSEAAYPVLARLTGVSTTLDHEIVDSIQAGATAHPEDAEAYYDVAVVLWRTSRSDPRARVQIQEELLRAIAINASRSDMHLLLGVVDAESGQKEDAAKELETSLALTPGNAQAHYRLYLVDRDLGRSVEAKEEMKRFLALRSRGETLEEVVSQPSGLASSYVDGSGALSCSVQNSTSSH